MTSSLQRFQLWNSQGKPDCAAILELLSAGKEASEYPVYGVCDQAKLEQQQE